MAGGPTPETGSEHSRDVVPELPTMNDLEAAATGNAFQSLHHHRASTDVPNEENTVDDQAPPPSAFHAHHNAQRRRRGSSASRVAIDHFDPEGVLELKRTLTHQSITAKSVHRTNTTQLQHPPSSSGSTASVSTAVGGVDSEKFDLEKLLREMVKRYVS